MTRRDRIAILLDFLLDVREGLPEREPTHADDLIALMCTAWNDPAYQELEHLLPQLRSELPRPYWHLAERYLRYGEVRVAYCRRCGNHHATQIGSIHKHPPGKSITLKPKVVKVVHRWLEPRYVGAALDWLEANYRGDAYLPKAVEMVYTEQAHRQAI